MESEFVRQGFVRLSLPDERVVTELRRVFKQYCQPLLESSTDGFYYSLMNKPDFNRLLKTEIAAVMQPSYEYWFSDYRNVSESFLVKRERVNTELLLHQDWNYVDEQKYFSATVWCPLYDVSMHNGGIFLLPGSHRLFQNFRSATFPTARIAALPFLEDYIHPVALKAGEALAFHPGVFHGSYPNPTPEIRPVMASIAVPAEAGLLHYQRKNDHEANVYAMDEDALLSQLPQLANGILSEKNRLLHSVHYVHPEISGDQLLSYYNQQAPVVK